MSLMPGVVIGTVMDLSDPLGEGRIGVKYEWLPGGPSSGWAPMSTPLAGKSRGMFFMPELKDEVLVAFDQGKFDHPYIVGFLWNGVDTPPDNNPQHRIIKTPGGLELRFEDDNLKIEVKTPGGLTITMDDGNASIRLQGGGRSITMQDGSVRIT
jgi:uncharacterized protein involved in type VI secretion and phage assembly